jgi:hypothetical protein
MRNRSVGTWRTAVMTRRIQSLGNITINWNYEDCIKNFLDLILRLVLLQHGDITDVDLLHL